MITFKKLRYKNFLSSGNQFTDINFVEHETNLIVGTNGAGKSTMLDALTFVLFNKPFRKINKPQLINSVNEKDCVVEIEFTVNHKDFLVRRGIKPNLFDIEVNGELLHKEADDRANQKILEENILKVNYKSFTQIVILGSSTFVPFMQLSSSNRREVIEDLLDIRIFSAMNGIIKDKMRVFKEQVKSLDFKRDNLKEKIDMQSSFIEKMEKSEKEDIDSKNKKIEEMMETIDTSLVAIKYNEDSIEVLKEKLENYNDAQTNLRECGTVKGELSQKLKTLTKEREFFNENTVCPTCKQDIKEEFRLNKLTDSQKIAENLKSQFLQLQDKIKQEEKRENHFKTLSKDITNLINENTQHSTRISGFQRQIQQLESEIQTSSSQKQDRNSEYEKLKEFKTSYEKVFDEISSKKEEAVYYEFAYSLLKDDGVKTKIIKKYLPYINQQVNRYLQLMDFYINFNLDEEFNETVNSPIHENFSYSSFSEGEKMRIDLALLFTWREVARLKNSVNTNLLIMDEVFDSSLDGLGTDDFLKIIRYIIKDANIFVISHKSDLHDKFDTVFRFEKVKGFSVMVK